MQLDASKRLWFNKDGEQIAIGMTAEFLREFQDECWHILPNTAVPFVKEGSPLFTVETNDALRSILSPFAGRIIDCSYKAQNDPHCLTAADEVIRLSTKQIDKKKNEYKMLWDEVTFPADDAIAAAAEEIRARDHFRSAIRRTQAAQTAFPPPPPADWGQAAVAPAAPGEERTNAQQRNMTTIMDRYNAVRRSGQPYTPPNYGRGEAFRVFSRSGARTLFMDGYIAIPEGVN